MMVQPHGGMLPFAFLSGLAWLAILAGVVLLIIWAVRSLPGSTLMKTGSRAAAVETPLEILARRFASGEITAEEYQRARDLLRGDSPNP